MRFLFDEEIRVSIGVNQDWVNIRIGDEHQPDQNMNLKPEEARALATALNNAAEKAEGPTLT